MKYCFIKNYVTISSLFIGFLISKGNFEQFIALFWKNHKNNQYWRIKGKRHVLKHIA